MAIADFLENWSWPMGFEVYNRLLTILQYLYKVRNMRLAFSKALTLKILLHKDCQELYKYINKFGMARNVP